MTNGLKEVIKGLEKQKTAIERALAALREVDGTTAEGVPSTVAAVPARRGRPKRKGGMTPEGRRRLSEALKKRWAVKRAASQVRPLAKTQAKAKAKKKGGMTPEGRKRLSEALKKRWAVKRAAAKK